MNNITTMEARNNAVIYPRYSSHGQNEQTIETQIQLCMDYARKQGLNVVKIFDGDKGKSASKDTSKRKDLHKMLALAESGTFQYIIVYALNRFARNRAESVLFKSELEKYGVKVLSATENIANDEGGELYEMILEWRDEKFSRDLSRRVIHGIDTSVSNGTFCGGTLIYGYKVRKEPIAGKNDKYIKYVDIDEEQAEIVRIVFKEYASGKSKDQIAHELNKDGKRYKDKEFKGKTFDLMLKNEKYTGDFDFGGRRCENMYPQIIDRLTFDRCQALLRKNEYFKKSNVVREPYPLSSRMFCGYCGEQFVADGGVNRLGNTYKYYTCKNVKKGKCKKNREDKHHIEQWVMDEITKFFRDPRRINRVVDDLIDYQERRTSESEVKAIEAKIVQTKKQIDSALDTMIMTENVATKRALDHKINDMSKLVTALELQISQMRLEQSLPITRRDIANFISEFLDGNAEDKAFQKRMIENVVNSAYVYDDQIVLYFSVGNNKDTEPTTKQYTDQIVEKTACAVGSTLIEAGRGDRIRTCGAVKHTSFPRMHVRPL